MSGIVRFLCPRERARHKANVRHKKLLDRKVVALHGGPAFEQHEELAIAEQACLDAHQHPRMITCFCCGTDIDMAKDEFATATICSIVEHAVGKSAVCHYFQPPHDELVANGEAGVVVLLKPPETGTLGICLECQKKLEQYLEDQVVTLE